MWVKGSKKQSAQDIQVHELSVYEGTDYPGDYRVGREMTNSRTYRKPCV